MQKDEPKYEPPSKEEIDDHNRKHLNDDKESYEDKWGIDGDKYEPKKTS